MKNHTTLKALTRNLDDLQCRVETAEGQPMEAIYCLENELHRLLLTFQPSAPSEPLDEAFTTIHGVPMFCPKANHFYKHFNPGIYPHSMGVI